MKSKKLLLTTLLALGCITTYVTLSSSSSGQMGVSATGCGGNGCHGNNMNANTILSLTGIPASGYVIGTTYPMTLTVTNTVSNPVSAGFDLTFSGGTISNASPNTMIMGAQLHHTAPKAMASGTATWTFNWTPPATGTSATVDISGNAVNGDNLATSADIWNKTSMTFTKAIPASINDFDKMSMNIYPNPSNGMINIQTGQININSFYAISLSGSTTLLTATEINNGQYQINTMSLATGNYILLAKTENNTMHALFSVK